MSRMNIQAAVTMGQLQNKLDLIGHNIANVNTAGYKTRNANFSSLLFQNIDNFSDVEANAPGRVTPQGIRQGSGARLGSTAHNLSLGALRTTDRQLDVALLAENHLLQVEVTENGVTETRYTRDGALYLQPMPNGQLTLTTSQGQPIIGQAGQPIQLEDGFERIAINNVGEVVTLRNGTEVVEGQLAVVEAVRPQLLETTGHNLFRLSDLSMTAYNTEDVVADVAPFANQIQSGTLEQSNVDLTTQMTELLQAQRLYQMNARTISMHDQMRGLVNQIR
ncbi:flagellar basal-body rod protein FlgG [Amphibacillus marinus]|uniref:Flagellar basal-body rod protein FlgG n=1 Tax=Amphibacillus marinus TaxID=872970 RepID=A0A1H8N391_9BACI|nr:flagellar hook-basal body protein [Amphibacillus marinus]SEO24111.1 flagellar basal-body rod protein FlgG [Amphibacillus marinus]